jgi:hypothetical protein
MFSCRQSFHCRQAKELRVTLDQSSFASLKGLAAMMRNTYDLAVGISPLLVLYPRKLDAAGIRRDYLIAVCNLNILYVRLAECVCVACCFFGKQEA